MNYALRLACLCAGLAIPLTVQADGSPLARNCAHCHGLTGMSNANLIPHIGGQKEDYLKRMLMQFKQGKRPSLFMERLAKGYSDQELAEVSTYFARLTWSPDAQATDPALVARGRGLAQQRCMGCHGGEGGQPVENAPLIAGQWADYLKSELEKFMSPRMREPDPGMLNALAGLDGNDLEALGQYYASQR